MSKTATGDEDSWYHGAITREHAESLLLKDNQEGSFLVRTSTSSAGAYVLSALVNNGDIAHLQIYKHEKDAFFSIEEGKVIHGLDELIKFYKVTSPDFQNEEAFLKKPILGGPPPPETRHHGGSKLLHRATQQGDFRIVKEFLDSQEGPLFFDAKNENGQSAMHLAAIIGRNDILGLLINMNGNVNAKDSRGMTPLHYACINNFPETVRFLIATGMANPQIRRSDNGWVPMHEAAWLGHTKCIKTLLKCFAPKRPRTTDGKLPVHLAMEANRIETVEFFDTHCILPPRGVTRDDWYHNQLERETAVQLLSQCEVNPNPMRKSTREESEYESFYLLRRSVKKPNVYVLTIQFQKQSYNFEIGKEGNYYFIDDGPYLDSLEHLVSHYSKWSDGLPCVLTTPVGPTETFASPEPSAGHSKGVPPPLPKRVPFFVSPIGRMNDIVNNNNDGNEHGNGNKINDNLLEPSQGSKFRSSSPNNSLPWSSVNRSDIPSDWIVFGEHLGTGEFGEVYKGTLLLPGKKKLPIAIKTLRQNQGVDKQEFIQEAQMMMTLEHENIVKLVGVSLHPSICIIQELVSLGSMQDYLIQNPEQIRPEPHLRLWAHQIAKAMVYLKQRNIIHRDLAARNILLSSLELAKLSDFGLSRALNLDSDYYKATQGGRWPIKWYAIESFLRGQFSYASDVWSFGVTLWEMYSYGDLPFGDLPGIDVIGRVENGERLPRPHRCPEHIFEMISRCWSEDVSDRPTCETLEAYFKPVPSEYEV